MCRLAKDTSSSASLEGMCQNTVLINMQMWMVPSWYAVPLCSTQPVQLYPATQGGRLPWAMSWGPLSTFHGLIKGTELSQQRPRGSKKHIQSQYLTPKSDLTSSRLWIDAQSGHQESFHLRAFALAFPSPTTLSPKVVPQLTLPLHSELWLNITSSESFP